MKTWSRCATLLSLTAGLISLSGCMEGVRLLQETERGGVVVYPYVPQRGSMTSSFRAEALRLIDRKCGRHYRIVREGEAKSRDRVVSAVQGAEEIVRDHRWGMEFECL